MPSDTSGVRKAAVLLISLSQDQAAAIMKRLPLEAAEEVGREIASLSQVNAAQRREVFSEFYGLALANSYVAEGGLEYAKALLKKSLSEEEATRVIKQVTQQVQTTPFSFLQKAESENLLTFIQDEHPQTIALVLSHLNASAAAGLLISLPPEMRADVALRMGNLDQISPEIVNKIAAVIGQKLQAIGEFSRESYGGIRAVAEMFNRLDSGTSKEILEVIEHQNPNLVETIRHLMFVFEDMLMIDVNQLKEVMARVDRKSLTYALKGTSEQLRDHFLQTMSARASEMLKEDMEALGPVRIKEVETAQQQIIALVRQLESEGVITMKATVGDQYVV